MSNGKFLIVSDGACSGNPGPGGWGMIFITPDELVQEFGGHDDATTNNRMEMSGYLRGLQEVYKLREKFPGIHTVRIISDSKYTLDGAQSFVDRWEKNGWKTVAGGEVKNQDIWEKISKGQKLLREAGYRIEYELVKGHAGHGANERVDQIAVKYTREEHIDLYSGPLSAYTVSFEKKPAFQTCYLSYVGGVLKRHKTWDECKKATEGKGFARFKKVKTAAEEKETLATWNVK